MARKKKGHLPKPPAPQKVTDGLNFDEEPEDDSPAPGGSIPIPEPNTQTTNKSIATDGRTYSPYYTPHPKTGKKGGVIGHPPVDENDRKISLSLSCTSAQKELYKAAAKKDGRKLPDFINKAIEEYIEKHRLK